jgi:hypothetical protein
MTAPTRFVPLAAGAAFALGVTAGAALAQQAPAPAPAAPPPATAAAASPAKKELVAKLLQIQRPAVEAIGVSIVEAPVLQMRQALAPVFAQRVPADKREALARDLEAEIRKYGEEVVPIVRERAARLAPETIGTLLESRFSEEELRQLISIFESPAFRKYQQLGGELDRALREKLVAELRPTIEPKVRALDQAMSRKLQAVIGTPAAAPASPAASAPRR